VGPPKRREGVIGHKKDVSLLGGLINGEGYQESKKRGRDTKKGRKNILPRQREPIIITTDRRRETPRIPKLV